MKLPEFIFTDWKKPPQKFRLLGWRNDHAALLLLDSENERSVLTLQPLVKSPRPDSLPTMVRKARLIPPPCSSKTGAANHEALAPTRRDWPALMKALKQHCRRLRD